MYEILSSNYGAVILTYCAIIANVIVRVSRLRKSHRLVPYVMLGMPIELFLGVSVTSLVFCLQHGGCTALAYIVALLVWYYVIVVVVQLFEMFTEKRKIASLMAIMLPMLLLLYPARCAMRAGFPCVTWSVLLVAFALLLAGTIVKVLMERKKSQKDLQKT